MDQQPTSQPSQAAPEPVVPAMAPLEPQPKSKLKFLIIAVVAVLILAGAAWAAYAAYYSPNRVWQRFVTKNTGLGASAVTETFSFSYQDNGKPDNPTSEDNLGLSMFSGMKVGLDGTAYVDLSDAKKPAMSGDVTYSFGSGDLNMSAKISLVGKDGVYYMNVGNLPFFKTAFSALNSNQPVDWVKIDPAAMQAAQKSGSVMTPPIPDFNQQLSAYQDIMQKDLPGMIQEGRYLNRETVQGVPTTHFANTLNKAQLKTLMHDLLNKMVEQAAAADPNGTSPADLAQIKSIASMVADNLVDRTQISTFETWIGTKDNLLHRVKLTMSVPSFVSFASRASSLGELDQSDPQKTVDAALQKLQFDGVLSFDAQYFNYGKTQAVTAPANALDLAKKIQEQMPPSDAGLEQAPPLK